MKNLLYKLLLILLPFTVINVVTIPIQCKAQIAFVSSTSSAFGVGGGTTGSINTTGADRIVIGVNGHASFWGGVSDNKGSTWNLVRTETAISNGAKAGTWYCDPCNVGTGHTFTTTAGVANIFVISVSGTRTASTPLDQQNGGANSSGGTQATGSITPTANGCLIFAVYGGFNPGASPTITSGGTGFSNIGAYTTSTSEAGRADYKIQTGSASSENVTYNSASSPHGAAIIISIFPPAAAVTTEGRFFQVLSND